jgi:hypothetical protein
MLRRIALGSFALAVAFVVACGHQVTPNPSLDNSNLSGKITLYFNTVGPMNFTSYTYAIIIDTCGQTPPTPYPNVYDESYAGYSYGFLIGGNYGLAFPTLEQYILTSNSSASLNPQNVPISTSTTQFVPNSNNENTQFQLTFTRSQLDNPKDVAQPCPNITPAPATGASPTTAPTATSVATGATPTATPSPNPNSMPTTAAQQYWYFNFFSLNASTLQPLDSLGLGSGNDNSYNSPAIDTDTTATYQLTKQVGTMEPSDPSAQITSGEIINYQ